MTFQAPKTIPGLEDESNRALTRALSDIQNDLSGLSGSELVTPVQTADYLAQLGEFVRTQPPAAGMKVLLPPGTASVQSQIIPVTVQSVLSGGSVTVSVAGGTQKIDGNATKVLSVVGLTYFKCLGTDGWTCLSGDPNPGSIPLTDLAPQAANTVVANATAAAASPTAFPVGANTVLGRVAGNIVAAQLVGAQVATGTLTNSLLATMAANTIKANATAGVASPTDVPMANAESVFGRTSGNLQAIDSAVQTALIRAAGSVFWASCAANQVLRRSGAGDLGFGTLVDGNIGTNQISAASQAQMAANTIKSNATAALANESDLVVGTNTVVGRVAGNIVAAQLVAAQVTNNTLTNAQIANNTIGHAQEAQPAANTIVGNWTAGAANQADNAVGANTVVGRVAGNVAAAQLVDAQITTNTISNASRAQMAQRTVKGNLTLATANEADNSTQTARENISGGCVTQTTAQLQTASVTNVTPGAYTILANTLEAGSEYLCEMFLFCGRGATGTATNLIIELLANGAVVRTLTIAINLTLSTNGQALVTGRMTARTIGAGGTMMYSLSAMQTVAATVTNLVVDPPATGAAVATTALDTTANRTLEMRARLSAATATVYVQMLHGTIEKVR